VRQNDRVVVSLAGRNLDGNYHEVALLDLLPAGFEIESVVNDETVKSFPFLPKITPTRISEARDDRFFAAFDLGRRLYRRGGTRQGLHQLLPRRLRGARGDAGQLCPAGVNVSDMYAPRIYARSDMGRVTIAPR
jgi:Large extracellular alpha-helical protein